MTIEKTGGTRAIKAPGEKTDLAKEILIDEEIATKIKNLHKELGIPDSLYTNKMQKTTMKMGTQTETFGDIKVTWSYDPYGIGLVIQYKYQ